MLTKQIVMAIVGLSSGFLVAGGLFGFIVSLGVVSDFADRTQTGNRILLYEKAVALGGICGNIFYLYQIPIPFSHTGLAVFGLLVGIFVGAWAMALAEVLNVFPVLVRRGGIMRYVPYLILATAFGKGMGALVYFLYV